MYVCLCGYTCTHHDMVWFHVVCLYTALAEKRIVMYICNLLQNMCVVGGSVCISMPSTTYNIIILRSMFILVYIQYILVYIQYILPYMKCTGLMCMGSC